MKQGRRIGAVIVYLILGSILIALGIAGVVDEFWCGMGTSLVLMGVLYLIHFSPNCQQTLICNPSPRMIK